MNEKELIEKAMESTGCSQNQLAKKLGLKQPSLSQMKNGKGTYSDEVYVALAELAGIDPVQVLIERHTAKAGPKAQKVWQRIGAGLSAVAFGALILSGVGAGAFVSKADANQSVSAKNNLNAVYIMRSNHFAESSSRHR